MRLYQVISDKPPQAEPKARNFPIEAFAAFFVSRRVFDNIIKTNALRLPKKITTWIQAVRGGMGWEGLEPSTNALKGRCSTIELPTRKREMRQSTPLRERKPRKLFAL